MDSDIARPYFPGIEAVFNISINFNNIQEIIISEKDITECLRYTDSHQRVFRLTELYSVMLKKYNDRL